MVIGEVLMTQSIEVYVEQVLVWCIIWGRDRYVDGWQCSHGR